MKLKLTISLLFLVFCFTKIRANNSSASLDSTKVIISCVANDKIKLHSIKKLLISNPLVQYNRYCINQLSFLITYSGTQQEAEQTVQNIRKEVNLGTDMLFVKQYSYGDILNFCETQAGINEFGNNN